MITKTIQMASIAEVLTSESIGDEDSLAFVSPMEIRKICLIWSTFTLLLGCVFVKNELIIYPKYGEHSSDLFLPEIFECFFFILTYSSLMIVWISKFNKQTHDNQDKQNTEMLVFQLLWIRLNLFCYCRPWHVFRYMGYYVAKDLVLVIHYPSSLTWLN